MKKIPNLALGLIILIGGFITGVYTWKAREDFALFNRAGKAVVIDRIQALKRLEVLQAELFSYKIYENNALLPLNTNEFAVLETGKAIYGTDLAKDISIKTENRNIELILPDVEIFDLVVNPDSVNFIGLKKGLFTSQQDFEELKKQVSIELFSDLKLKSNNQELISQARKNTKAFLIPILKDIGFAEVNIRFRKGNSTLTD
jgi:hypothetical protein